MTARTSYWNAEGDWTFSGSYGPDDVTFLLKPAAIAPVGVAEKERLIQSGQRHYSEMLSAESVPDARYMALYHAALTANAARLRRDVEALAKTIAARPQTATECVILSLARAGTPIGVLLKRALQRIGIRVHHYSISIIRGRGIDAIALAYVAARHGTDSAIFLDGWTGKGAIRGELDASLSASNCGFAPFLAVIADPAGRADLAATFDDYVIPSGLLNGIVSGLVSRSVLNDSLVKAGDFHACLTMPEHAGSDQSRAFIAAVEAATDNMPPPAPWHAARRAAVCEGSSRLIESIAAQYHVRDINRIKPGIAEATRAILRRVPDRVFVRDRADPDVTHILLLAGQAGVPVIETDLQNYRAITIIKDLGGDQP
jgi:Phosphoribosyl transferase (PRTase)/PELOTA RNA binding domain